MNAYDNAAQWENSAKKNFGIGEYRTCVYCCCLSIELYLKSQLLVIDPNSEYEGSHDVLAIYQILSKTYKPSTNIKNAIRMSRKYHNESRYPGSNYDFYDEKFAREFLAYLEAVKNYIENDCHTSMVDLQNKFAKKTDGSK